MFARSFISTVSLAEVQGNLVARGLPPESVWLEVSRCVTSIETFTEAQAKLAGSLMAQTTAYGLSLGDRACLALALTLDAPVYTADVRGKTLASVAASICCGDASIQ